MGISWVKFARVIALSVSAVLVCGFADPSLQDQLPTVEENIAFFTDQLSLTEEQIERIRPVLEKDREDRQEAFKSMERSDGERPSFREMRKMKGRMDKINTSTEAEMKSVLTKKQFKKYRKLTKKRREEMRSRMRVRWQG